MLLNAEDNLLEMLRNTAGRAWADDEDAEDAFDGEVALLESKKRVSSTIGWKGDAMTSLTWVCKAVAPKLAFIADKRKKWYAPSKNKNINTAKMISKGTNRAMLDLFSLLLE